MKRFLIFVAIMASLGAVSAFHGIGFRLEDRGTNYTIRTLAGTDLVQLDVNGRVIKLDGESITIASGSGSPLNVLAANPGSIYFNTGGGSGTTIYEKQSGTGTTGWVPITTGAADNLGDHSALITLLMNTNSIDQVGDLDFNWTTLANGATPTLNGKSSMVYVGGTTAITNLLNGTDGQFVTLNLDAGESISNNASMVTASGTDITGPAIRSFVFDVGEVPANPDAWREVGPFGGGAADNLGNHTATQLFQMGTHGIDFTWNTPANGAAVDVTDRTAIKIGGTTPVTSFTGGVDGQIINVVVDTGESVTDQTTIETAGNTTIAGPTVRTFMLDGSTWKEQGADNLGNHTATTTLLMSNQDVDGVGRLDFTPVVLANGATPSVADNSIVEIGGATAVTNFTGGSDGQQLTVIIGSGETVNHNGTNIVTASATNMGGPCVGTFVLNGSVWRQVGDDLGSHVATKTLAMTNNLISTLNLGTLAVPSISFNADVNTGLFSPGANQVCLVADGNEVIQGTDSLVMLVNGVTLPATVAASLDATPTVLRAASLRTANASATTITNFDDGVQDQIFYLHVNDANTTIADNATISLKKNANYVAASGDVIGFYRNGTVWNEITATVAGDNLGNHIATDDLQMSDNGVINTGFLAFDWEDGNASLPDGTDIDVTGQTAVKLGGTTLVSTISGGVTGQVLIILMDNGEKLDDNTTIILSGNVNFEPATTASITLINYENSGWYEIARTEYNQ